MEETLSKFIKITFIDKVYSILNFDITVKKLQCIFNIKEISYLEDLNGNRLYPTLEGNFPTSIPTEVFLRQQLPKQAPIIIYPTESKFVYDVGSWNSVFLEVMVGYHSKNLNMRVGCIQFKDLSSINADRKISKVYLRMVGTYHESTQPIQIFIHRCETDWKDIVDWNQLPVYSEEPYSSRIIREAAEIPFHWDVTDIVVDWVTGFLPNYGIVIKTDNTYGIPSTKQFHNSNAVKNPCLLVFYAKLRARN